MDFDEIQRILAMVKEHELAEFELEHQGFKIRIRKDSAHAPVVAMAPPVAQSPVAAPPAQATAPSAAPEADDGELEFAIVCCRRGGGCGGLRKRCGHRGLRHRWGDGHDRRGDAVLPDADLEALVLELELGELVLLHHGENPLNLVEIHPSPVCSEAAGRVSRGRAWSARWSGLPRRMP